MLLPVNLLKSIFLDILTEVFLILSIIFLNKFFSPRFLGVGDMVRAQNCLVFYQRKNARDNNSFFPDYVFNEKIHNCCLYECDVFVIYLFL